MHLNWWMNWLIKFNAFSWSFNCLTVQFYMVLIKFSLKWLKLREWNWLVKPFYHLLFVQYFQFISINNFFKLVQMCLLPRINERDDEKERERARARHFHFVEFIYISVFRTDINDITAIMGWWVYRAPRVRWSVHFDQSIHMKSFKAGCSSACYLFTISGFSLPLIVSEEFTIHP